MTQVHHTNRVGQAYGLGNRSQPLDLKSLSTCFCPQTCFKKAVNNEIAMQCCRRLLCPNSLAEACRLRCSSNLPYPLNRSRTAAQPCTQALWCPARMHLQLTKDATKASWFKAIPQGTTQSTERFLMLECNRRQVSLKHSCLDVLQACRFVLKETDLPADVCGLRMAKHAFTK